MTKKRKVSFANVAPNLTRATCCFGPPPLLVDEDSAAYDSLLAHVSEAVKPSDVLEEIWVRDVVDLTWEVLRLRRLKASLLNANLVEGMKHVLRVVLGDREVAESTADAWAMDERPAAAKVEKLLDSGVLSMDAVIAETFALKINDLERIDRMIMMGEARRNAALREVDRHRSTLAQALRKKIDDIEDAEFQEIAAPAKVTERSAR